MKIFNVIHQDRHMDTTATPFLELDEAIGYARKTACECQTKYPEDIKEEVIEGWLFYISYSCEGDCLWITEHELEIEETSSEYYF